MGPVKVGVYLPQYGADGDVDVAAHARHAEEVGLESVWVGDHLIPLNPVLDSTLVAATVAAVTERVKIGFGVMIPALRPVAWTAKQVATLQHLSSDRILLGIGSGGDIHGDATWRAIGVPYHKRGRCTDAALEMLPTLIAGEATMVNGEDVTLAPGATMPPVLVAGSSTTLRRVARFGDEWYPAFITPEEVSDTIPRLAELANDYGRPAPGITLNVSVGLGDLAESDIEEQVQGLMVHGLSNAEARRRLVFGEPARAAESFAEFAEAGVDRIVAYPFAGDRFRQSELLAETGRLVNG